MKVLQFLDHFYREAFIIFLMLVLSNNYLHPPEEHILADGIGYYDYLPSIFIHHDFARIDFPKDSFPKKYDRILSLKTSYSHTEKHIVNKYGIGTALLKAPTFLMALLNVDEEKMTGYEKPFHVASYHAVIFYLFLALVLFRQFCKTYDLREPAIVVSQVLLVFATPTLYYTIDMTAYSHVYSFFAISGFLLFTRKQILQPSFSNLMFMTIFLSLIFLIRSINVLIVLAIPFLTGSLINLKSFIHSVISNRRQLIIAVSTFLVICFFQFLTWYMQTGLWFLDPYPNEQFFFNNPQIINILFSYRKGLFMYTPVLLISALVSLFMIKKGRLFSWLSWMGFFFIITYIFSSWWSWSYNECYGSRVYIDFLSILILPLTMVMSKGHILIKLVTITLCMATIPLNVVQIKQFKSFILKWDYMNEVTYKKVFFNTNDRLKSYLWKKEVSLQDHEIVLDTMLSNQHLEEMKSVQIFSLKTSEIPEWNKVVAIRVEAENDFSFYNVGYMKLCIGDLDHLHCDFFRFVDINHLANGPFEKFQKGNFNFVLNRSEIQTSEIVKIDIDLYQGYTTLRNPRLFFLKKKEN